MSDHLDEKLEIYSRMIADDKEHQERMERMQRELREKTGKTVPIKFYPLPLNREFIDDDDIDQMVASNIKTVIGAADGDFESKMREIQWWRAITAEYEERLAKQVDKFGKPMFPPLPDYVGALVAQLTEDDVERLIEDYLAVRRMADSARDPAPVDEQT